MHQKAYFAYFESIQTLLAYTELLTNVAGWSQGSMADLLS